jgi:PEP-CTERM motif
MSSTGKFSVLVLLGALAAASVAQGGTISFSGLGFSGTMNPNSLPWVVTANDTSVSSGFRGISVWGTPGLGAGNDAWPSGIGSATAFTITFTGLPNGVTIDQTADPTPFSFDDYTRFQSPNGSSVWTPNYSGGNSVTFTAPGPMTAGTNFFVNVAFTGGAVNDSIGFNGSFTTTPEPGSLSLMFVGLAGAAILARRRKVSND